ncbi:MAG: cation diffusion facilitator family transporter, partial [Ardenticatenaceae bacterium]
THQGERRPLAIALAITATFLVVEIIGGLLTNSLALLADAGHMATDVAALGLSLFAVWLARRPRTPRRSFGYYRAEILAALLNAATLVAISFYIFWEANQRLGSPPEVDSATMLLIAVAGLAANGATAWILTRGGGHEHNLNTRGAFLHVLGDILGSAGAIAAALIMLATGWYLADPLLSAAIGLLILRGAWQLLSESVDVLMEATPQHIEPRELRDVMAQVDGVADVHDLHVRTVTSGLITLSGHVELSGDRDWYDILLEEATLLRGRFGISHVTLQPEEAHALPEAFRGCSLDSPEGLKACCVPFQPIPSHHHHH